MRWETAYLEEGGLWSRPRSSTTLSLGLPTPGHRGRWGRAEHAWHTKSLGLTQTECNSLICRQEGKSSHRKHVCQGSPHGKKREGWPGSCHQPSDRSHSLQTCGYEIRCWWARLFPPTHAVISLLWNGEFCQAQSEKKCILLLCEMDSSFSAPPIAFNQIYCWKLSCNNILIFSSY